MTAALEDRAAHRAFLNRYYGISKHFYDLTRKYYLFGRDALLDQLLAEPWSRLVEVGVGTGRNLRYLEERRPLAHYGGVDASDEMVNRARENCPFAKIAFGFAEDFELGALSDGRPDRVLFSYSLSMIADPALAIAHARANVSESGRVVVVDFGDFSGFPPLREPFRRYLAAFHVNPLPPALFAEAQSVERGPLGYYFIARFAGTSA